MRVIVIPLHISHNYYEKLKERERAMNISHRSSPRYTTCIVIISISIGRKRCIECYSNELSMFRSHSSHKEMALY